MPPLRVTTCHHHHCTTTESHSDSTRSEKNKINAKDWLFFVRPLRILGAFKTEGASPPHTNFIFIFHAFFGFYEEPRGRGRR